jgi:hypothetical protein
LSVAFDLDFDFDLRRRQFTKAPPVCSSTNREGHDFTGCGKTRKSVSTVEERRFSAA